LRPEEANCACKTCAAVGGGGAPRGGSGAGSGPAASGFPTVTPPPNDYLTGLGQAEVRGDGVLLHNGQFRTEVVDLRIPCRGFDFVWKRTYQSGSGTNLNGFLGSNWDFSWGAHFIVDNPSNPVKGYFSRGDFRRDTYDNAQLVGTEYIYATLPAGFFDIRTAVVSSGTVVTW